MGTSVLYKWKCTTTSPYHFLLLLICGSCLANSDAFPDMAFCLLPDSRALNLFCNSRPAGEGAVLMVPEVRLGESIISNSVMILSFFLFLPFFLPHTSEQEGLSPSPYGLRGVTAYRDMGHATTCRRRAFGNCTWLVMGCIEEKPRVLRNEKAQNGLWRINGAVCV